MSELLTHEQPSVQGIFDAFLQDAATWQNVPPVNGSPILGIHPELIISTLGNDSFVCRGLQYPDYVVKVYKADGRPLTHSRLSRYQELNRRAASIMHSLSNMPPIQVNPIEGFAYWPDQRCYAGISPYISGFNLSEIFSTSLKQNPDMQEVRQAVSAKGITSTKLNELLGEINNLLNDQLHTKGISIVPVNVKAHFTGSDFAFVITDLAGSIRQIKSRGRFARFFNG